MKLVAAKCPNCGAQIDVDQNSDSTRCEYCNSKVIVEEAIEKYKLEVSGSIEINNLPKFDNYMKLGDRYYKDKDYSEAHEYYTKAIELDPDNYHAIIRQGFSKSLGSSNKDIDVNSAIKALKNAAEIMKKSNAIGEYKTAIAECNDIIKAADTNLFKYYNQQGLSKGEVEWFNVKIQECLNGFEYLYTITEEDWIKEIILNNIIHEIDNLLLSKVFRNGNIMQSGVPAKSFYHLNSSAASVLKTNRQRYVRELDMLKNKGSSNVAQTNNKFGKNDINKYVNDFKNITPKNKKIICYVFGILLILAAFGAVLEGNVLAYPVCVAAGILLLPPTKDVLTKKWGTKVKNIGLIINILRVILVVVSFIVIAISPKIETDEVYKGKWNSENGMSVNIKSSEIEITDSEGNTSNGTYTVDKDDNVYTINVKLKKDKETSKLKFKCEKNDKDVKFYLENDDKTKTFFKPEKPNSSYNYLNE